MIYPPCLHCSHEHNCEIQKALSAATKAWNAAARQQQLNGLAPT